MKANNIAHQKDIAAIYEALEYVWRAEMNFIFEDKSRIENTLVVSFDNQSLYVWYRENGQYHHLKIPHSVEIPEDSKLGWTSRLSPKELIGALPKKWQLDQFTIPKISGGLLTDVINLQKQMNKKSNPYTTWESYLATIIHEFGHVYYNHNAPWCYANKEESLNLLGQSMEAYKTNSTNHSVIRIPSPRGVSEIFAFCTDYTAAILFWPEHKKDLDSYNAHRLANLIEKEKVKNLRKEDSVLNVDPHYLASVVGKLTVDRYPDSWPTVLQNLFKID